MSFSFGLDIGERSLKCLAIKQTDAGYLVDHLFEEPLPSGIIQAGQILKAPDLIQYLQKLLHKSRLLGHSVVAALPECGTFLRLFQIRNVNAQELRPALEEHLQEHLPFALDQVYWDFAVINTQETVQDILVGAAPKILVEQYLMVLKKINLVPIAIELEALALARALLLDHLPGCTLILDLGQTKATLLAATSQTVLETLDARAAAQKLTDKLAEELKIGPEAAEEMKCSQGLFGNNPIYQKIVVEYTETLAKRLQSVIAILLERQEFPCPAISEILLTGGGALLKGLPEYLEKSLHLPIKLSNPLKSLSKPNASASRFTAPEAGVRFTTAYGLALTALNYDSRA